MNPPGGRVGVRDGVRVVVDPPGVDVVVTGVACGLGWRSKRARGNCPRSSRRLVMTSRAPRGRPLPATDGPVTVTSVPLATAPSVGALVLAPERTLTRVVVRSTVPLGKLPGASGRGRGAGGGRCGRRGRARCRGRAQVTVAVLVGVSMMRWTRRMGVVVGVDVPVRVPVRVEVGDGRSGWRRCGGRGSWACARPARNHRSCRVCAVRALIRGQADERLAGEHGPARSRSLQQDEPVRIGVGSGVEVDAKLLVS